ncbi:hypothetical protein SeLEV6574_g01117 [Synchytrium endobioticum]|uniref:Uncharacterized protein n=1 Tax=Synchytrium endobioticum TaxID=286115 RepID=A0A507DEU1_9FUNG|nr:hypothetical protein SeLEV6574_g01117 [Synchytrium endobioticum]
MIPRDDQESDPALQPVNAKVCVFQLKVERLAASALADKKRSTNGLLSTSRNKPIATSRPINTADADYNGMGSVVLVEANDPSLASVVSKLSAFESKMFALAAASGSGTISKSGCKPFAQPSPSLVGRTSRSGSLDSMGATSNTRPTNSRLGPSRDSLTRQNSLNALSTRRAALNNHNATVPRRVLPSSTRSLESLSHRPPTRPGPTRLGADDGDSTCISDSQATIVPTHLDELNASYESNPLLAGSALASSSKTSIAIRISVPSRLPSSMVVGQQQRSENRPVAGTHLFSPLLPTSTTPTSFTPSFLYDLSPTDINQRSEATLDAKVEQINISSAVAAAPVEIRLDTVDTSPSVVGSRPSWVSETNYMQTTGIESARSSLVNQESGDGSKKRAIKVRLKKRSSATEPSPALPLALARDSVAQPELLSLLVPPFTLSQQSSITELRFPTASISSTPSQTNPSLPRSKISIVQLIPGSVQIVSANQVPSIVQRGHARQRSDLNSKQITTVGNLKSQTRTVSRSASQEILVRSLSKEELLLKKSYSQSNVDAPAQSTIQPTLRASKGSIIRQIEDEALAAEALMIKAIEELRDAGSSNHLSRSVTIVVPQKVQEPEQSQQPGEDTANQASLGGDDVESLWELYVNIPEDKAEARESVATIFPRGSTVTSIQAQASQSRQSIVSNGEAAIHRAAPVNLEAASRIVRRERRAKIQGSKSTAAQFDLHAAREMVAVAKEASVKDEDDALNSIVQTPVDETHPIKTNDIEEVVTLVAKVQKSLLESSTRPSQPNVDDTRTNRVSLIDSRNSVTQCPDTRHGIDKSSPPSPPAATTPPNRQLLTVLALPAALPAAPVLDPLIRSKSIRSHKLVRAPHNPESGHKPATVNVTPEQQDKLNRESDTIACRSPSCANDNTTGLQPPQASESTRPQSTTFKALGSTETSKLYFQTPPPPSHIDAHSDARLIATATEHISAAGVHVSDRISRLLSPTSEALEQHKKASPTSGEFENIPKLKERSAAIAETLVKIHSREGPSGNGLHPKVVKQASATLTDTAAPKMEEVQKSSSTFSLSLKRVTAGSKPSSGPPPAVPSSATKPAKSKTGTIGAKSVRDFAVLAGPDASLTTAANGSGSSSASPQKATNPSPQELLAIMMTQQCGKGIMTPRQAAVPQNALPNVLPALPDKVGDSPVTKAPVEVSVVTPTVVPLMKERSSLFRSISFRKSGVSKSKERPM